MTTTLEGLRQSRLRFSGGRTITAPVPALVDTPEIPELWQACDRIYRITLTRIDRIAEHADRANAMRAVPFERMELSETFSKRYGDLITELDVEWLSARPDLEAFRAACDRLEALCVMELRVWLDKMREVPE